MPFKENLSYFVIHIETKEGFKCLNNVFKKLIKYKNIVNSMFIAVTLSKALKKFSLN